VQLEQPERPISHASVELACALYVEASLSENEKALTEHTSSATRQPPRPTTYCLKATTTVSVAPNTPKATTLRRTMSSKDLLLALEPMMPSTDSATMSVPTTMKMIAAPTRTRS
jgi:hypothetical protein